MGYLSDRVDDLQEGADDLAAGDEVDRTNQLLSIIAAELTDQQSSYYQDGFEETAPGETDDGRQTAQYSSREGIRAKDDPDTQNWGFTADTVVIRNLTKELAVAFKDPTKYDDATITIKPDDSPFVLSGVYGIRTSKMWYQSPGEGVPHEFDLIAVSKRGDEQ